MALVPTFKVSAVGTGGSGTLVTGSFTPSNNSLLVAISQQNSQAPPTQPGISGGGLTWTKQAQGGVLLNFTNLVTVWTAPVTTGASMTVTITNTVDGDLSVSVTEFTGYNTGTPVGLTHSGGDNSSRSGSYAGSMGGTTASDSYVIGAGSVDTASSGDVAVGSGYTTIASFLAHANDFAWSIHEYKSGALSTFDYTTLTTTFSWAAAAIEIKAAAGGGGPAPFNQENWPVPQTVQFPTSLRTWTASFNLNLIGKDALPPGRKGITFELTKKPLPAGPTWVWSYNQNLVGNDVLPPGRKGLVFDGPPKRAPLAGPTWTSRYNDNLIGKDVLPAGRRNPQYEEVQPIVWRRGWELNLLQATLAPSAAVVPFRQRDWSLPQRAPQPDRTWVSTAAELQLRLPPPGEIWTDLPPAPQFWRNGSTLNLVLSTLVAQDSFPPGEVRSERPLPLDWRTGSVLSLLQSTLATVETAPFAQYDWPLPRIASQPDRTWVAFFNPNLVGQDAFPPGVVRSDTPPPVNWRQGWALNLVLSTLVGQDAFPPGVVKTDTPPPLVWKNGFELNLLLSTLGAVVQLPLNQYNWPLPGQGWQAPRTWTASYNINLISQDQLPIRQMDWPLPNGYFYPASVRVSAPLNVNLFPPPPPVVVTQEYRNVKVAGGEFGFMGLRGGVIG